MANKIDNISNEVLNKLYMIGADVLADSFTPAGSYTAKELSLLKYRFSKKEGGSIEYKDKYQCTLIDVQSDYDITVTAGGFSCTFPRADVFYYIFRYEKIFKVKPRKFSVSNEGEE